MYSNQLTTGSQADTLPTDMNKCTKYTDNIRLAALAVAQAAGLEGTLQAELPTVQITTTNNGVYKNESATLTKTPPCQLEVQTGTRNVSPAYLTTFVINIKQYFGISDAAAGTPKEEEILRHQANLFAAAVNLASLTAAIETPENLALAGSNFEVGKLEQSADVFPGQTLSVSVSPTKSRSPSATPTMAPSGLPSQSPSKSPSANPSKEPTKEPTKPPTKKPTLAPTRLPTKFPTKNPTVSPTGAPSDAPSVEEVDCGGKSGKAGNCKSPKSDKSPKSLKSLKSTKKPKEGKGAKKGKKGRQVGDAEGRRGKLID